MSRLVRPRSRALIAATSLGLVAAPFTFAASPANAADVTDLVISEAYGGGGNSGAAFKNDFVEIHNPTSEPISLQGVMIQYRSADATGPSSNTFALPGVELAAGDRYLVAGAAGTNDAPALPTPDATMGINLSGTGGQVYLAQATSGIDPIEPAGTKGNTFAPAVIDFVGWGASTSSFEGTGAAPATANGTSSTRDADDTDTDDNSVDLFTSTPTPGEAYAPPAPPEEVDATIAEVQGTGATSPLAGDVVTTQGVVTAMYPTGGLNGMYVQTGGSGGATDATPGASDAVFVYGASSMPEGVATGDSVEVTGLVSEFQGITEITPEAGGVTELETPLAPVTPQAVLPGTDCELPGTGCLTGAALEAEREAHEGELFAPTAPFTVSDSYDGSPWANSSSSFFGEIGLAAGSDQPLVQPTEVVDAQDAEGIAQRTAYNEAHRITLDDGASTNLSSTRGELPWLRKDNTVRVGAAVTFEKPVIFEYRFSWKVQPTAPVTGAGTEHVTFEQDRPAAPESVGGDLELGTFNVLNYFSTTGEAYETLTGDDCTAYTDKDGEPTTVRSCASGSGPRGAWDELNLQRQQDKIVAAINTLDADIVSLEEIENSAKFHGDANRDQALEALVTALNAAAGETRWDFVPSPAAADLPPIAEQDVIRTAFIFDPATVDLVGASEVLTSEAFADAREPLAQAFKAEGGEDADAFGVVVNHFKSKGSGTDDGTGQGNANPERVLQAEALSAFADQFAADRGIEAMFLTGDFNSYSQEDPMQVLYADGFAQVDSDTPGEETYSFAGLSGSLDHVLANPAAQEMVTGADIWNINSGESVYYEYSRFNTFATDLYEAGPFRASDHDPEIVGIDTAFVDQVTDEVQILGINDFHGRISNNAFGDEAGAAVLSGAIKELRAANPDTVFAAAGDLIGASTFESFIAKDKPTIDALNEAGLEVSAVGNHEFDAGYDDLLNRVMAPYDADTNPYGGAGWEYIGANVGKPGAPEDQLLEPTWVRDFGDVQVGFVGAVTEDLPSLVSPDGIEGVVIEDIVEATNREADRLEAEGVDIVVLLVHEGAATTDIASATDPDSAFGEIVNGVNGNVDAIVSGHTHLAYNHAIEVPEWIAEGRDVTTRPVVSAGQYGTNLNQMVFSVDPATGEVTGVDQRILDLKEGTSTPNYDADPATAEIVADAVAEAKVLGAVPLGEIGGPFNRARINGLVNGQPALVENRGGESTLGNLVAEVQRWATETEEAGAAEIAFMNPGGLRANMTGEGTGAFPRTLTYMQAANVQPFANTLVNMDMTGAEIKSVLEEQWQPDGASRPFLKLGMSEGFTYTYDPSAARGDRIKQMRLDGTLIRMDDVHSVTANSFLAAGGDNFFTFGDVAGKQDTGKSDLQAMVDYMAEFADEEPLPVDFRQRAVGVDKEIAYTEGEKVDFTVSSLAMTGAGDVQDQQVEVSLGDEVLGTFPVDNTLGSAVNDEYGVAEVSVRLPEGTPLGSPVLTVTGLQTGTTTKVPVSIRARRADTEIAVTATPSVLKVKQDTSSLDVTVSSPDGNPAGFVAAYLDGRFLTAQPLSQGSATLEVGPFDTVGEKEVTVEYIGDAYFAPASTTTTLTVQKAQPRLTVTHSPRKVEVREDRARLTVEVSAEAITATGRLVVRKGTTVLDRATLTNGKGTLVLDRFARAGEKRLTVTYNGSSLLLPGSTKHVIRVVR